MFLSLPARATLKLKGKALKRELPRKVSRSVEPGLFPACASILPRCSFLTFMWCVADPGRDRPQDLTSNFLCRSFRYVVHLGFRV
jgi:hypothetical protein